MTRVPNHWIHSHKYLINTHPNQRLRAAVLSWLSKDISGAYIYGAPRIGKTHQMTGLGSALVLETGETVSLFVAQQRADSLDSAKTFWTYLLITLQIEFESYKRSYDLYEILLDELKKAAMSNAARRVVLVIDEAQDLSKKHYLLLKGLANDMLLHGFRLMIISLGSDELPTKIKAYNPEKNSALINRFFVSYHQMYGLRGVKELEHALSWYDTPRPGFGSPKGYTADFLPILYAQGFRLASLADAMWERFTKKFQGYARSGFHMQFFCVAVNELLTRLIVDGEDVSVEQIDTAITTSGLLGAVEDATCRMEHYEAA